MMSGKDGDPRRRGIVRQRVLGWVEMMRVGIVREQGIEGQVRLVARRVKDDQ
ncbi:hypothetical protein HK104_000576, partial [Borealophlyctis nickersoniae]